MSDTPATTYDPRPEHFRPEHRHTVTIAAVRDQLEAASLRLLELERLIAFETAHRAALEDQPAPLEDEPRPRHLDPLERLEAAGGIGGQDIECENGAIIRTWREDGTVTIAVFSDRRRLIRKYSATFSPDGPATAVTAAIGAILEDEAPSC